MYLLSNTSVHVSYFVRYTIFSVIRLLRYDLQFLFIFLLKPFLMRTDREDPTGRFQIHF